MKMLDGRDAVSLLTTEGIILFARLFPDLNYEAFINSDAEYWIDKVIDEKGASYTYISVEDYVLINKLDIEDVTQIIDVCERFARLFVANKLPTSYNAIDCVHRSKEDLSSAGIRKYYNGTTVYYDFDKILTNTIVDTLN